jgi:hypothetical protein
MGDFVDPGGRLIIEEKMTALIRQTAEDGVRGSQKRAMTLVHGMKTMDVLGVFERTSQSFAPRFVKFEKTSMTSFLEKGREL